MTKAINKNTKQNIIEVATKLFALNGFDGASIRDICKQSGANISLISYYFGGKKGLYEKIISGIVENIIRYMTSNFNVEKMPTSFEHLSKPQKIDFFYKALNYIIDYFYSNKISDEEIMIFFREQITSEVPLNAMGYNVFRKLLASILEKKENDKEVIFRCITVLGQIYSARVLKQFSLNMMNQKKYTTEDNLQFKNIVISQIRAIMKDAGVTNA